MGFLSLKICTWSTIRSFRQSGPFFLLTFEGRSSLFSLISILLCRYHIICSRVVEFVWGNNPAWWWLTFKHPVFSALKIEADKYAKPTFVFKSKKSDGFQQINNWWLCMYVCMFMFAYLVHIYMIYIINSIIQHPIYILT